MKLLAPARGFPATDAGSLVGPRPYCDRQCRPRCGGPWDPLRQRAVCLDPCLDHRRVTSGILTRQWDHCRHHGGRHRGQGPRRTGLLQRTHTGCLLGDGVLERAHPVQATDKARLEHDGRRALADHARFEAMSSDVHETRLSLREDLTTKRLELLGCLRGCLSVNLLNAQSQNVGAQPRAARERCFGLAFCRARLVGCSALLAGRRRDARHRCNDEAPSFEPSPRRIASTEMSSSRSGQ